MNSRAHLSIGEVLSLLQEEFPDVTISKIRFLESQGLLDPERTPSGYRKFYESDIDRLRWILRQQKDNFLPLKVIKDRLAQHGEGAPDEDLTPADRGDALEPQPPEEAAATEETQPTGDVTPAATPPAPSASPAAEPHPPKPTRPLARPTSGPPNRPSMAGGGGRRFDPGPTGVSLSRDELVASSGLPEAVVTELERYGLITGRSMGRDTVYDEDALVVARLAAGFHRFGVEARHLRMYKVAAEREAGFFEQVVMPLMKQRNPTARRQAVENLGELTGLGDGLRAAMLRHALRGLTQG